MKHVHQLYSTIFRHLQWLHGKQAGWLEKGQLQAYHNCIFCPLSFTFFFSGNAKAFILVPVCMALTAI